MSKNSKSEIAIFTNCIIIQTIEFRFTSGGAKTEFLFFKMIAILAVSILRRQPNHALGIKPIAPPIKAEIAAKYVLGEIKKKTIELKVTIII